MALDTYIVLESGEHYKVLRYKAMELMDSRTIQKYLSNPLDKRVKIVSQFIADGKPSNAAYWIENGNIKSLRLTE
jgi:hypothetical protein